MKNMGKFSADLVLSGGHVITMEDPIIARQMDIALCEGRIVAIGGQSQISQLVSSGTEVINVEGKTLMPGLIDSHNHMVRFGENLQALEVSPAKVGTINDLLTRLKQRAGEIPQGKWLKAWGYDDTRLAEKRHPTNKELDRACPNHPVSVMRTCMHAMAVNSLALKMAGITAATPDPQGGEIGRDENGEPNGLLFELGAMSFIDQLIPHPSPSDCARSLKIASDSYVSEGLTTVTEAGAGWSGNPHEAAGFQMSRQSGDLKPRVSLGLMEETYHLFAEQKGVGLFTGFGDDSLWIGPAKFVADGGIGARTAALRQPYENSDYFGVMCENPESLTQRMVQAHKAGFQISVHAIGDRTMDMVITAYESILARFPREHRHRIEHAALCHPDFFARIKRLGLIPVVQPAFLYYLGDSFIRNLGEKRLEYTIPLKSMLDKGITVAGSSDRPVTEGNPWRGIWSAVNRTTIGGDSVSPKECLNVPEALKLYTRNGAYANYVENRLGTLSPGKLGDIIVLEKNPLEVDCDELKDIQVDTTIIQGKVVYQAHD